MSTYGNSNPRWAGLTRRWSPRRRAAAATTAAAAGLALLVLGPAATALGAHLYVGEREQGQAPVTPVGSPVRDGGVVFVVHTIRCGAMGPDQAMNGKLCEITIGARNRGTADVTIPASVQKLAGPDGTRHLPLSDAEPAPFGTLAPGEAATATLRYDLPRAAQLTHLTLHGGPYTAGQPVEFPRQPLPLLAE